MAGVPNEVFNFTGPVHGMQVTLNEASVERKISQIWEVLQVNVKFSSTVGLWALAGMLFDGML
jgi:hypothetical protein